LSAEERFPGEETALHLEALNSPLQTSRQVGKALMVLIIAAISVVEMEVLSASFQQAVKC